MILLSQFLKMMSIEKKATRSTLSAYEADLLNFYNVLQHQDVQSITSEHIQDYLLTQMHLSPSTVTRRLSCLRQFYIFLMDTGKIKENPLSHIKATQYKLKPPPCVDEGDLSRLLEGAKTWGGAEGKRLFLLLQILCIADISVNDLVSLPFTVGIDVLKQDKPFLVIPIEGKANQIVPLTDSAFGAFQGYIMVRDIFLKDNKHSPWLFPSLSHKGHLTRQRFGQLLKELSLKVGLDSPSLSLYTIRDGFRHFNRL